LAFLETRPLPLQSAASPCHQAVLGLGRQLHLWQSLRHFLLDFVFHYLGAFFGDAKETAAGLAGFARSAAAVLPHYRLKNYRN